MAAPGVRPITIPDDFTVWAASDLDGKPAPSTGCSPPPASPTARTAGRRRRGRPSLVTGDVVDLSVDWVGLVWRLASLRAQASPAGGCVALLWGNHEAQVLGGLGGEP